MILSIITINYNNCAGLKRTIDSVVSQSFQEFEWIIIDGGSTDGSLELIERYSPHFSYWVSEPDKGVYQAMNKGIERAEGEYLLFLNSGDWLVDANTLQKCLSYGFSADVIYGDSLFVFENQIVEYRYPSPLSLNDLYTGFLGHASSFIRSSILKKEKYNEDYRIVSDWEFWIKLAMRNGSFFHIDEFISYFDTTGISSTEDNLRARERKQVISELVPVMVEQDLKRIKELEVQLDDRQVKQVLFWGRKNKVYHKMITFCLELIRRIDRFSHKETY